MWKHFCAVEKTWISVGKDEPCNWCEAKGEDRQDVVEIPAKPVEEGLKP